MTRDVWIACALTFVAGVAPGLLIALVVHIRWWIEDYRYNRFMRRTVVKILRRRSS